MSDLDGVSDDPRLDRQFVGALARGLDILQCYRPQDRDLSHQEIVARTGLPKSTVTRLIFTLGHLGFLQQVEESGRYRMGPAVLKLGYAFLANLDIRRRAQPPMQELADYCGVSVGLGLREGHEMVYVECCRGMAPVTLRLGVGARIDLFRSIMGRAWLASRSEAEAVQIAAVLPAAEREAALDRVRRAAEQIARDGFCRNRGEWVEGVNSVGAPLMLTDGHTVMALNCGGPEQVVTPDWMEREIGPRLAALAAELSVLSPQDLVRQVRTLPPL